jgi:hypothetical protein
MNDSCVTVSCGKAQSSRWPIHVLDPEFLQGCLEPGVLVPFFLLKNAECFLYTNHGQYRIGAEL